MRKRTLALIIAMAALIGLSVILGVALGQGVPADDRPDKEFYADSDKQAFASTKGSTTTDSGEFQAVPGLSGLEVCGRDGASATVSLELSGGAVEVRVRADGKTLSPGPARIDSGEQQSSHSFTFGRELRGRFSDDFDVEWRSATGGPVTLHDGTLRVLHGSLRNSGCA